MYGVSRIFAENDLLASTHSTDNGIFSGVTKVGLGSATMAATGSFKGLEDTYFQLKIVNVAGGKSVGQAKFDINYGGGWLGDEILTSAVATEITFPDLGLFVAFTAGTGDDFQLDDIFYVTGIATYGERNLLDERRDSLVRFTFPPTVTATTKSIDFYVNPPIFGTAPYVFGLFDSQIPLVSGATVVPTSIVLKIGTTLACTDYSFTLTYQEGYPILCYLTGINPAIDYGYAKIEVTMPANNSKTQYFYTGEAFLGKYTELAGTSMANWGSTHGIRTDFIGENTTTGTIRKISQNINTFGLKFALISNAEVTTLQNIYLFARGDTTGKEHPLFFHEFSDEVSHIYWTVLNSDFEVTYDSVDRNSLTLALEEVAKGYVI